MFFLLFITVMMTIVPVALIISHWIVYGTSHKANFLKMAGYLCISAIGFLSASLILSADREDREKKEKQEDAEWKKNGCLVYKYECGSKRKYECEKKTNSHGKVMIDDTLIPTYPTCSPQ